MKKSYMEPFEILYDGSVPEVEMIAPDAGGQLVAYSEIKAEWACLLFGNKMIIEYDSKTKCISDISNRDKLVLNTWISNQGLTVSN